MKFKYFKFPISKRSDFFGHSLLKPIIPIKISAGTSTLRYMALIDSGADFCIFDAEIGEALGLNVRSGLKENFGGIQERGSSLVFIHNVIINVGGWDHTIKAGFSYDIAKWGYGILGQKGFFDIFIVVFDLLKEEIELKERKK
jgi:hypothetical protein